MSTSKFDVLIIGSGIAGLSAAIKLAEAGIKIGLVTREKDPNISNTFWAQGGIIYPKMEDGALLADIDKASSHTSNAPAAEILESLGPKVVEEVLLEKAKTNFVKEDGNLKFTKEAAHSKPRILFQGDFTGREIQTSLLNYIKDKKRFPNIHLLTGHTAIDLITPLHHGATTKQRYEDNKVLGAYLFNQDSLRVHKVLSKVTILATGGIGALYLHHSNSEGARGDGIAMAKRAGAFITDMEFIQFHPTTLHTSSGHRRFLISEALRGEGGVLKNSKGESFMQKYHPDQELAPRDVVARSIVEEMIATKHECVYLDMTSMDSEWLKERFPTIYSHCREHGIEIDKDQIPVVPAAHYTCGGVKTNLKGETNLDRLYAVGEVACTGLHGANRLASTSLLEGLTFGYLAAENILGEINDHEDYEPEMINDWSEGSAHVDMALLHQDFHTLKQTMWNYLGLTRSNDRLKRAGAMLSELNEEIHKFYRKAHLSDELIGLRNAAQVSLLVLNASERNRNSVGCFFREN